MTRHNQGRRHATGVAVAVAVIGALWPLIALPFPFTLFYFASPSPVRSIAIFVSVCLWVCLSARVSRAYMLLVAVAWSYDDNAIYVMYFRCYGCRHDCFHDNGADTGLQ